MLDAAFIRANLEAVKSNCKNRNLVADVDKVIVIDDERKKLLSNIQAIQQKQNELSKLIPKEKDPTIKQQLVSEGKALREQANAMEAQAKEIESNLKSVLNIIPNMTHPDAPVQCCIKRWKNLSLFTNKGTRRIPTGRIYTLASQEGSQALWPIHQL